MKQNRKFKNEEDFTINAVIPWLKTRNEYGDIEYTGGKDEYGRDVVFSKTEIGNRKMWWAIQVKDDDIKGINKSDSSIQEIINQLKSAMTMPYTKKGDTAKITIQGLIVITMGKITTNAANIIKESDDLKGRTILFYEYPDILNNLKESPMNVSLVSFLIRVKNDKTNASCKSLIKGLNKIKTNFDWKYYHHEPQEDMFDSCNDFYTDLSFNIFFEEINKVPWEEIKKAISIAGFNICFISLRLHYSKVFSTKNLEEVKKRIFKNINVKIYEDQLGPCFIYNCDNFNFLKEDWLKNVNNLQILQKN